MNSINEAQKNRFVYVGLAVGVLLAVFLAVLSISFLKGMKYVGRGVYPTNVITVNGTGEVMAVPDTATFSYSVVEEGKTPQDANDKASKKTNTILAAVKALGVDEKDIQTTGYNVNPRYDYTRQELCTQYYCPPGKQVISGYEVSQTMTVKVRKTADAGGILAKVGELGASNVSGLNFVIDDPDAVQAEARNKAIADAKAKAGALSKSLGVRLDKIVSFYENGDRPVMYDMAAGNMSYKTMEAQSAAPIAPEIQPGQNKVVSNVTITYEMN